MYLVILRLSQNLHTKKFYTDHSYCLYSSLTLNTKLPWFELLVMYHVMSVVIFSNYYFIIVGRYRGFVFEPTGV